jgi:hypothetical protein
VLAKYDRAVSGADSPRGPGIDDTDADPPVAKGLTLHRLTDMSKVPEGVTVVRTVEEAKKVLGILANLKGRLHCAAHHG